MWQPGPNRKHGRAERISRSFGFERRVAGPPVARRSPHNTVPRWPASRSIALVILGHAMGTHGLPEWIPGYADYGPFGVRILTKHGRNPRRVPHVVHGIGGSIEEIPRRDNPVIAQAAGTSVSR